MRWLRLLKPIIFSGFRSTLTISETSTLNFSVWLTDIDVTIMNHAAMMSVFETGRIDFMVRTGFFKLAKQQGWYVPNSSISIQFFRPMKVFQKAVLTTRVFHMDEHFIYVEQIIKRHGKDIAICLVKSKVKSGRENVPTSEIARLLNSSGFPMESKEIIDHYEMGNDLFKKKLLDN